ncbi:hypothetical protein SNE40_009555 [Patella caerulea]|uniref:Dihydrolipoyllysine-residue succinyltransferase component of 2-oxoglutarate dehydrogenase complex, mitochondrial n=1 Tax=Patella caerulea TaxID=87958 RepID=A0AAN8PRY8_PATCE
MLSSRLRYLPRCCRWFPASKLQLGNEKLHPKVVNQILGVTTMRCLSTISTNRLHLHSTLTGTSSLQTFHNSASLNSGNKTVNCPPFAESITEGDIRWEKGVGDFVNEDELVAEVETDKTNVQVNSPSAGVIEELLVADGETVSPGAPIFKIKPGKASDAPAKKTDAPAPPAKTEATAAAASPSPSSEGPIPSTPPPVPPLPTKPTTSKPTSSIKVKSAPSPTPSVSGGRGEQRVKMNRMRQRIAQRLKEAQNTCAMLTTFNEIDMSNVMEMRANYKEAFLKKTGLKLGFMSAFVKATAYALQDQPVVNAVIDDLEIIYRDYIDISVAVSTPKGLVVPVIRNVETMNYAKIEKTIAELGDKARDGSLAIEDMDGGTFTISNGGVFGSLFGTPIINPPQSAILGMHAIVDRPVVVKGKVEIRPMMFVALTYDHRLIDGREAVTFLRKIKTSVEDPRTILLDL